MSISNSIRLTLNLKDKNIKFKENFVEEENIKGIDTLVYSETLSPDAPSFCPKCGCINKNYDIIKHGSKTVNIKMPRMSNRKVIDIVYNRQLSHLKSYFFSYPKEARDQVQTICIDMYAPYVSLIKSCFPNAKIILDRFHIIQLLSRSLNKTRVQEMNTNKTYYNKLKRYWRILLKDYKDINQTTYQHYTCFKYKMSEVEVLNEILRSDKELETTYWYYQKLKLSFNHKNSHSLIENLKNHPQELSKSMKTSIHSLLKFKTELENSISYKYSNGTIEGTNNLIKVIKRIAFAYRS